MKATGSSNKRILILVIPTGQPFSPARPSKTFTDDKLAMSYAKHGDQLLELFEDGTTHRFTRGADCGAEWGASIAEAYLYSNLPMLRTKILDMCFNEDIEASKAFVSALVDYVIDCQAELEA